MLTYVSAATILAHSLSSSMLTNVSTAAISTNPALSTVLADNPTSDSWLGGRIRRSDRK